MRMTVAVRDMIFYPRGPDLGLYWKRPPGTRDVSQRVKRWSPISFDHRDLQIRRYDADSHHPSFVSHTVTTKRSREPMIDKSIDKNGKNKLQEKRAARGK